MYTIQISVRDKIATQTDGTVIINGNSDYNIEFDFDAEWADLNNKVGIFAYNDAAAHKWAYQPVMFSGNTCTVPILRDIHCVYVGVTAGNVRVTTPRKGAVQIKHIRLCGHGRTALRRYLGTNSCKA